MGRPRKDDWRVLGPYWRGDGWQLWVVGPGGDRAGHFVARRRGEEAARALAAQLRGEFGASATRTVADALAEYERHQESAEVKGAWLTAHRLRLFFADKSILLKSLDKARCERYARAFGERLVGKPPRRISPDYEANTIIEARTFLRRCVAWGWISRNPMEGVVGSGRRRNHGKPQLRLDEARAWAATAVQLAQGGDDAALAALLALLLGLRSSEITHLRVRDLDDGASLLWVGEDAAARKSRSARRQVAVPAGLRDMLVARTKTPRGRKRDGEAWLWGRLHWRDWPSEGTRRICRAAGVPLVSAHGMRGLHASLASAAGLTGEVVAAQLGHADASTTAQSYSAPAARARGRQAAVLRLLIGGAT
jgi:integrase